MKQAGIASEGAAIKVTLRAGKFLKLRPFGGGSTSFVRGPCTLFGYERPQLNADGTISRLWIYFPQLDLATLKEPDPKHLMADSLKQVWDDDDSEQPLKVQIKRQGQWEEYFT